MKKNLILFLLLLGILNTENLSCLSKRDIAEIHFRLEDNGKTWGIKNPKYTKTTPENEEETNIPREKTKNMQIEYLESDYFTPAYIYLMFLKNSMGQKLTNLSFNKEQSTLIFTQKIDFDKILSALDKCKKINKTHKKKIPSLIEYLNYSARERLAQGIDQNVAVQTLTEKIINLNTDLYLDIKNLNLIIFRLINGSREIKISNSDKNTEPQDKLAPAYLYVELLSQSLSVGDSLETLIFSKEQKTLTLLVEDMDQDKLVSVLEKCEYILRTNKHIIPNLENHLKAFASQLSTQKIDQNFLILMLTQEIIKFSPKKTQERDLSFIERLFGCGHSESNCVDTMDFSKQT